MTLSERDLRAWFEPRPGIAVVDLLGLVPKAGDDSRFQILKIGTLRGLGARRYIAKLFVALELWDR